MGNLQIVLAPRGLLVCGVMWNYTFCLTCNPTLNSCNLDKSLFGNTVEKCLICRLYSILQTPHTFFREVSKAPVICDLRLFAYNLLCFLSVNGFYDISTWVLSSLFAAVLFLGVKEQRGAVYIFAQIKVNSKNVLFCQIPWLYCWAHGFVEDS